MYNDINLNIGAKDRSAGAFRSAEGRMKRLSSSAKMMAGALGIGLGASALIRMTSSAIEYGSALTDAAIATNTNIEALQVLRYGAQKAGADEKKLELALVKANKAAVDASNGLTTYSRAFDYLNINVDQFIALPSEQKMITLANSIAKSTDKNRSAAAVMDIIGSRNAPKLMEVLQDLAGDGYGQLEAAARSAGQVMSDETAKKLDAAADAIARFKTAITIKTGEGITQFSNLWDLISKGVGALEADGGFDLLLSNPAAQAALENYNAILIKAKEETDAAAAAELELANSLNVTVTRASLLERILHAIPDAIVLGTAAAKESADAYTDIQTVGERTTDALRARVVQASDDMADAILEFAQTGKFAFNEMANSIIQDMVRIMIQQQITTPLATSVGGFLFGTKDGSSGLFSSLTSSFTGGKAAGGAISAGRSYLVGEQGPELLTSRSPATVIPNDSLTGGSTIINFNVSAIDSASFSSTLAQHQREITGIVENAYRTRGKKGPLSA